MHNSAILAKENTELRAANIKQEQKREKSCFYIDKEGILTAQDTFARTARPQEPDQHMEEGIEDLNPGTR
ncbi:hypothetical protein GX48_01958 [Paracoccidioides brasiliensis]|nr:hypothetical protein GX48_01958 [Paracoccidioides brasiliensis]